MVTASTHFAKLLEASLVTIECTALIKSAHFAPGLTVSAKKMPLWPLGGVRAILAPEGLTGAAAGGTATASPAASSSY